MPWHAHVASPRKPWWRRWFGTRSERAAARFLQRLGYRILARNYTCPHGELDLVALDGRLHRLRRGALDRRRRRRAARPPRWTTPSSGG